MTGICNRFVVIHTLNSLFLQLGYKKNIEIISIISCAKMTLFQTLKKGICRVVLYFLFGCWRKYIRNITNWKITQNVENLLSVSGRLVEIFISSGLTSPKVRRQLAKWLPNRPQPMIPINKGFLSEGSAINLPTFLPSGCFNWAHICLKVNWRMIFHHKTHIYRNWIRLRTMKQDAIKNFKIKYSGEQQIHFLWSKSLWDKLHYI